MAKKSENVVYFYVFCFENKQSEDGKNNLGNYFLQDFQLISLKDLHYLNSSFIRFS